MNKRVMIIDDEASIRLALQDALEDLGYAVDSVGFLSEAEAVITTFRPHVILLDMRLKDGNGIDFIPKIQGIDEEIKIIVITAYGDVSSAVKAIQAGAIEYVVKPFDLDEIEVLIARAIKQYDLNRRVHLLEKDMEKSKNHIITKNSAMKKILESSLKIAYQNDVTVLITGETGTGKELMADYIHENSGRRDMPLVKINCATLPKELFESELFGHEKYAFTGANQRKKGLFEIADGGTIFLDEVGEIPVKQQAKLLRVLEDRKIKRVGGTQEIPINVRVITATNRNLLNMVSDGLFRADFYYRLNVLPIKLLPLRERPEDVLVLAEHFLARFNLKFNKNFNGFSQEAIDLMMTYEWPGNVRELRNLLERACIVNSGEEIQAIDFPICQNLNYHNTARESQADLLSQVLIDLEKGRAVNLNDIINEVEELCINKALEAVGGNQTKAAHLLNISRFALKRRLDKEL